MTDFSHRQFLTLISATSQLPIPTIKMTEDIKMTTEEPTPTEPNHKKSIPLSDMDETIIREAEVDTLILGNDPSKTYNKSGPSSKKHKHDINTYEYDPSVSTTWKKNVANFFSRAVTVTNKSLLGKPI